ncbi:MarR family winged helix-turn-helix transcriptional regulator [Actinosynnema mirum]|uniref:MarR family winged helix-turn-helix transcriptional regulator n=1 Tax=Actinosynnema mirum TaxID=40567 RepID=UPI001FE0E8D6|nr:MarR family transcriptional regulator [Actinosynnema mirum]
MGELRELSADEDALWRALGRVSHLMPRVLDEEMTRATGLSMTEYAVLLMLAEAPERRLRMSELASAVALSGSRVTRVVDAMVRLGLLEKEKAPDDGRGAVAVLTDAGLARQRGGGRAAPGDRAAAGGRDRPDGPRGGGAGAERARRAVRALRTVGRLAVGR